jgi:hypothetical protein
VKKILRTYDDDKKELESFIKLCMRKIEKECKNCEKFDEDANRNNIRALVCVCASVN